MAERFRRFAAAYPVLLAALALSCLYFFELLSAPALPGNVFEHPLGWWGWFDQGKTLESALALSGRDLSASRHWYPMGYSLLGAPFIRFGFRAHPFALVDLACLLAVLFGFVAFARACGIRRTIACILFVGSVTWDRQMFNEWVIPWNSSPAAALMWTILPVCALWLQGRRYPVLLGLLVGAMPFFRPTEAAQAGICVLWVAGADLFQRRLRWQDVLGLAAGGALAVLPQLALHLAVYGPHPTEYMLRSRELGFTLHDFGWKAFVILSDPYPWFTEGPGLLRRLPWALLAFAGFIPALLRRGPSGMLAAALLAHLVLYVSYLDLLPMGIWRFNNIHYWKWAIPGYALLGWLLLRDLVLWRRAWPSYVAAGSLGAAVLLSLVRVAPVVAPPGAPAKMLEFHGPAPGFDQSYMDELILRDEHGPMANVANVRAFPVPGGMRVVALSRPIEGAVSFDPGHHLPIAVLEAEPVRYVARAQFGRPCWLSRWMCGRRETNGLLPPPPSR